MRFKKRATKDEASRSTDRSRATKEASRSRATEDETFKKQGGWKPEEAGGRRPKPGDERRSLKKRTKPPRASRNLKGKLKKSKKQKDELDGKYSTIKSNKI